MYYYSSVPSQCISPHNAFIMEAKCSYPGADSGGGGAHPPPIIGKSMIFWRKIVIFHTKYLKNFRASLGN